MKKFITILFFLVAIYVLICAISYTAHTAEASEIPIPEVETSIPEIETASYKSTKGAIYKEFSTTHLASRIVKFKMRRRNGKLKVFLTWHPKKTDDLAKDTYVIVKIIDKVIPNFHSISLKAIHPEYLRWTKRIFWDAVITRDALFLINKDEKEADQSGAPRPLFR